MSETTDTFDAIVIGTGPAGEVMVGLLQTAGKYRPPGKRSRWWRPS